MEVKMRLLKNFLAVALIGVSLLALGITELSATETRAGSMGGVGFYIRDNSNVFFFPGTIRSYSNQVIAELRLKNRNDLYTAGVHFPLGATSIFGIYLNRPLGISFPSNIVDNVRLERGVALFFGSQLGNMDLGLGVTLGADSFEDEQDPNDANDNLDESTRYWAISVGLSNSRVDLGATFSLPAVKQELGSAEDKWDGSVINVNGRYFHDLNQETKLVPLGTLQLSSSSRTIDSGISGVQASKIDFSDLNFGAGLGLQRQINDQNLVILAVEAYGLSKTTTEVVRDTTENSLTVTTLPGIYAGVESQIKPWLIGRLGAAQVYQNVKATEKLSRGRETESSSKASQFKLTFGLGLKFGSFLLDASINEGLLFDGPNFISGSNEIIAERISMTYNF
jgi:hypothetical protein